MDATELDILLEELETRVERLRALYEQYFLGIEKIPPHVAQKDVDRRLYTLRREQIRNTAKRFKLQTIIQRYNTFQQYWMRIMREIDNGTYKRHVLRAERTLGVTDVLTAAERKRLGLPERQSVSSLPPQGDSNAPTSAAEALDDRRVEATPSTFSAEATPDRIREQMGRDLGRLLDGEGDDLDDLDDLDVKSGFRVGKELDDPLLSSMPPPAHTRKPSARPVPRRSARPIAAPHGQLPPPDPRQSPGARASSSDAAAEGARPSAEPSATSPSGQPTRKSLRPGRFATGSGSPGAPGGLRLPASSAVAGRGLPPLPKAGVPRGAPPKIPSSPIISVEGKPKQPVLPPRTNAPVANVPLGRPPPSTNPIHPKPEQPAARKPNPAPTADSSSGAIASGRESVPRGLPSPRDSIAPRPSASPVRAATKSMRPEAARKPTTPPSRPKPAVPVREDRSRDAASHSASPPRKPADSLERARVEQIAEKLRDARKQTHEAGVVSVDALAKKLQTTVDELRKKHQGKRVDFDVVIKDGKAIVKPIVK